MKGSESKYDYSTLEGCIAWVMAKWCAMVADAHGDNHKLNGEPAEGELRRRMCWTPEWIKQEGELIEIKKSKEPRRIRALVQYIIDSASVKFIQMNDEVGVGFRGKDGEG